MPAYPSDDPTRVDLDVRAVSSSVPRGTAVGEVAKQLITLLTTGDVPAGGRLPPERRLAEQLGVGRSAVREALAALEILGIVTVRPGSGTYMRDSMSELLPTTLSWGLMLSAGRTHELTQVRSALEIQVASLAASRITGVELRELRALVDEMAESLDDRAAFIAADAKFHLLIAEASENTVLRDLLQTIRSLLRLWVDRKVATREQAEDAYKEHTRVYEALATGDPAIAAEAMRAHMATATRRLAVDAERPR